MPQISPALAAVMEDPDTKLDAETLLNEEYMAALYLFDRIVNAEGKTSANTDMKAYLLQTWREVFAAVSSRSRERIEWEESVLDEFNWPAGKRPGPTRRRVIGQ